jgi:hypothetical protein
MWLGHPECSRYVTGVVAREANGERTYHPLRDTADPRSERAVLEFFARWGGITFRADRGLEIPARVLGLLVRSPRLFVRHAPGYAWGWLRRLGQGRPLRALAGLATRRLRVNGLMLAAHHFMSRPEIETPLGQERLSMCIFHVPVDGRVVSMCEANALGVREAYYRELRERNRLPAVSEV